MFLPCWFTAISTCTFGTSTPVRVCVESSMPRALPQTNCNPFDVSWRILCWFFCCFEHMCFQRLQTTHIFHPSFRHSKLLFPRVTSYHYARLRQQPFWSIVQFMMRIQSALADAHLVSPWMGEVIPPSFNCLKCMKQLKDWISRKASTSSARKNGAVLHTHMPYATALCLIQSDTLHLGSDNYTGVFYLAIGATLFAKKGFR